LWDFFSPLCKTSPSLLFEGGKDDIRLSLFSSVYRRSTKPNFGVFKTEKKVVILEISKTSRLLDFFEIFFLSDQLTQN